jgi:peptide chain release factor 1
MVEKAKKAESRYRELEKFLADPALMEDKAQYQKMAKEFADIAPIVEAWRACEETARQTEELKVLLREKHDPDFEELAKSELQDLQKKEEGLKVRLNDLLHPKVAHKDQDIIMEIRAGTGGEEASLFAADLSRMYARYAEQKGWKVDFISSRPSESGGCKEILLGISGKGASRSLKWESGVHRVQRIPTTEASGRIHTSAATVAVLFEPDEVDINIDPRDLKIDVFRSSGPGGQSVNTTDSAVRITHLPSGLVVVCQDERSQLKNRMKAMRVLRARYMDKIQQENFEKMSKDRKDKIGTGDRSEKIRTYNFPDHRVTDHRVGVSLHKLPAVMDGDLNELVDALLKAEAEAEKNKS